MRARAEGCDWQSKWYTNLKNLKNPSDPLREDAITKAIRIADEQTLLVSSIRSNILPDNPKKYFEKNREYIYREFYPDIIHGYQKTPIEYAAWLGCWNWVEAISASFIDKDNSARFYRVLIIVADRDYMDRDRKLRIIKNLLKVSGNIEYTNDDTNSVRNGWNILHYLVFLHEIETIKWLLNTHPDKTDRLKKQVNRNGKTPLQLACSLGFYDCFELFLSPEQKQSMENLIQIKNNITNKINTLSEEIGPEKDGSNCLDSIKDTFSNRKTKIQKKYVLFAALNLVNKKFESTITDNEDNALEKAATENPLFTAGWFRNDTKKLVHEAKVAKTVGSLNLPQMSVEL